MVHTLLSHEGKIIKNLVAFSSCLALSFVAGSLILVPGSGKAVIGLGLVGDPVLTLDTPTAIEKMNVFPTVDGTLVSAMQSLSVTTDVWTGYSLRISMASEPSLATSAGTVAAPEVLKNNTWGFAIKGVRAGSPENTVVNGFDENYETPTPSEGSVWANPSAGEVVKNVAEAVSDDVTEVYYGARIDIDLANGTYDNMVSYTVTANVNLLPSVSILSVTPSAGPTAGGTAIEIVGMGFTADDNSITKSVTIGGVACENVSISSNTPSVGQDTIYCTTPAMTAGAKNVVVATWAKTATAKNGYTYVAPAVVSFVSPSIASTIAGTESGPVFTIVGSDFTGATAVSIGGVACDDFTVVSNTQIFCRGTNNIGTAGDKVVVVAKSSMVSNSTVMVNYSSEDYPTLQAGNVFMECDTQAKLFRDERDSQLYYVKKMADEKCWMVDNLKYANYGELHIDSGKYLTVDGTNAQGAANYDVAKYVDPGGTDYCTGSTNISGNSNVRCGLLYNWYAATKGTGSYNLSTNGEQASGSICPANFRLPTTMSNGVTAASNGTSYAAADFPVLNASMNEGSLAVGSIVTRYIDGWLPYGAWGGMYSGIWGNQLRQQGVAAYYWTSTANEPTNGSRLTFHAVTNTVFVHSSDYKMYAQAVRCVMEDPAPAAPNGIEANNISGKNPAVLDIYPTTGWEGDTIAITSERLFTNVTNITVGGKSCKKFGAISTSLATCVLPANASGTTKGVTVYNDGADVVDASHFLHMKVTYFDPGSGINMVNIDGVSYVYYAKGFTSADCAAMTMSNAAIGATPAASMAYFRDTRNKQVYKVKKMVDGKCWMVDNLKYIDSGILNTADGTVGMVYNNGDHMNSGTDGKYNTVNGTNSRSNANLDKAFYNNPMSSSYCSGIRDMVVNSLTGCGYLYNWYAATGGTGIYALGEMGTMAAGSICPANFRLPTSLSNGSTAASSGTSVLAADFPVLNASMNEGSWKSGTNSTKLYKNWHSSGAWGGVFSGLWHEDLGSWGTGGHYWSATAAMTNYVYDLFMDGFSASPGSIGDTYDGFAVRCVMP